MNTHFKKLTSSTGDQKKKKNTIPNPITMMLRGCLRQCKILNTLTCAIQWLADMHAQMFYPALQTCSQIK